MRRLTISLKTDTYDIFINEGIIKRACGYIKQVYESKKVYVITDTNVSKYYLEPLLKSLKEEFEVDYVIVPAGEESKCLSVYSSV